MRFIVRLLVTAIALWVAVLILPGIQYHGHWAGILGVAIVFGLVNAVIRPILMVLTCPLVVLTLGLFILILNALMLYLTSAISGSIGLDFRVTSFGAAVLGGLIVGIVSAFLNIFAGNPRRE